LAKSKQKALTARESAKRLSQLGRTEKDLKEIHRRRIHSTEDFESITIPESNLPSMND